MKQSFYIGYETLETFVAKVSTIFPIYLMLVKTTHAETAFGPGQYTYTIEVAQIRQDQVHYWRRPVAISQFYGDTLLKGHQNRADIAQSYLEAVKLFLKEQGLTYIPACVAVPSDARLLEGGCDRIGYKEEEKHFFLNPVKVPTLMERMAAGGPGQ